MDIYKVLSDLNISYEEEEHDKVYTVEEADNLELRIKGYECKNLFLKDNKKNYYLVVMDAHKTIRLNDLAGYLEVKKLSFASEDSLNSILGLGRGSVTPLGITNDIDNKVLVLLDKDIINKDILCHPNRNDRTIKINYNDLIKFIDYTKHSYKIMDL